MEQDSKEHDAIVGEFVAGSCPTVIDMLAARFKQIREHVISCGYNQPCLASIRSITAPRGENVQDHAG
jgi:hypothetical protein